MFKIAFLSKESSRDILCKRWKELDEGLDAKSKWCCITFLELEWLPGHQLRMVHKILTLFVEEDKVTFCIVLGVCDSWKMVWWWWDGACDISPGVKHMEHWHGHGDTRPGGRTRDTWTRQILEPKVTNVTICHSAIKERELWIHAGTLQNIPSTTWNCITMQQNYT